jgi:hypothetical protein|tara:strand:+ start:141 stop:338 length:198 start_codon:yes stop_codon:yes gene_type:complete
MPNMSYCRFENTTRDIQDCLDAIEDGDTRELSRYEATALREFLVLAEEILKYESDIEAILEEYED